MKNKLKVALFVFFTFNVSNVYANMDMTKQFEGFRSKPYIDTVGVKTIGYGFNMQACNINKNYITKKEADIIFVKEYNKAKQLAINYLGKREYDKLSSNQQSIITDMAYNMGGRLFQFKKLKQAIINGDNKKVVTELKNSKWAKQVKGRATHHINNW